MSCRAGARRHHCRFCWARNAFEPSSRSATTVAPTGESAPITKRRHAQTAPASSEPLPAAQQPNGGHPSRRRRRPLRSVVSRVLEFVRETISPYGDADPRVRRWRLLFWGCFRWRRCGWPDSFDMLNRLFDRRVSRENLTRYWIVEPDGKCWEAGSMVGFGLISKPPLSSPCRH